MEGNGSLKLTNKQREVLAILSDGECHSLGEMLKRLDYGDEDQRTLFVYVSSLRKLLRPIGRTIVWESPSGGQSGYRYVILVTPATSLVDAGLVILP